MNKVHLYVDDSSIMECTTELNDVYITTTDICAWAVWQEHDAWPKNSRGYNISFQNKNDQGFALELNEEGMLELFRVIKEAMEAEHKNKRIMND